MTGPGRTPERIIVLAFPDWPEERDFAPVFRGLVELVPQIEMLGPGLVAMRARGPARYYGSETEAANALLAFAHGEGLGGARVGIADGRFAAEQAATQAAAPAADPTGESTGAPSGDERIAPSTGPYTKAVRIVPRGRSAAFLAPLPVSCCADEDLALLLSGLGMYTLGDFAQLPEPAVRSRFGPLGARAHRHARGEDDDQGDEIRPQQPARDFEAGLDFEPPLDGAEQLAFACSGLATRFFEALAEDRLVCTTLRVTLTDDIGARHERDWSHPRFFTPADAVARIRWQLGAIGTLGANASGGREGGASSSGAAGGAVDRAGAGIVAVRLFPARIDRLASHEPGLWNTGPDERVHHHLSRAQGLLGERGVGTAILEGGRLLLDRQRFTPWGTAPRRERSPGPWPGALPAPQPSLVFTPPLRARLLGEHGEAVTVDEEDLLSVRPRSLRVEGHDTRGAVIGWSKPWPLREHWWEGRPERFRLQLELEGGDAWVLLAQLRRPRPDAQAAGEAAADEGTGHDGETREVVWFAEGRYD